jgi:hypothetical protein
LRAKAGAGKGTEGGEAEGHSCSLAAGSVLGSCARHRDALEPPRSAALRDQSQPLPHLAQLVGVRVVGEPQVAADAHLLGRRGRQGRWAGSRPQRLAALEIWRCPNTRRVSANDSSGCCTARLCAGSWQSNQPLPGPPAALLPPPNNQTSCQHRVTTPCVPRSLWLPHTPKLTSG